MEVFVVAPNLRFSCWTFPVQSSIQDIVDRYGQQQGLSTSDLFVVTNARVSSLDVPLQHGSVYRLEPRLPGGKGGFGSMLRALGAQIEKTTNREACRDLSGRRLRDVNHEKEMAAWLKKQAEREAEKEQRRAERLQRKLKEPKHQFSDPEYQRQCHDLSERLEDSVIKGLQASSSGQVQIDDVPTTKRMNPGPGKEPPQKKKKTTATACFWTGLDELPSSEEDDDDRESSSSSAGTPTEGAEPKWNSSTTSAELHEKTSRAQRARSSEDQESLRTSRNLNTRSSKDQEAPGTSGNRTMKSSEDQEAPGTSGNTIIKSSEDQEAPGTSRTLNSRSSKDQEAPGTSGNMTMKSSEDQEAPGTSGNMTMKSSEDQEAPGTSGNMTMKSSEDQEAPGTSETMTMKSSEDQEAPGTSGTMTMKSSEDQEAPNTCKEQTTRSPEDQEVPRSSSSSEEVSVDVAAVSSVEQLERLGLDVLKDELMRRGLKCGGTLAERAARLFSVRGLTADQIDPALLAKPAKARRK